MGAAYYIDKEIPKVHLKQFCNYLLTTGGWMDRAPKNASSAVHELVIETRDG
jgi:hypothetical protein